jgi:hypothetical protein
LDGHAVTLSGLPRVAAHHENVEFAITKDEHLDIRINDSNE